MSEEDHKLYQGSTSRRRTLDIIAGVKKCTVVHPYLHLFVFIYLHMFLVETLSYSEIENFVRGLISVSENTTYDDIKEKLYDRYGWDIDSRAEEIKSMINAESLGGSPNIFTESEDIPQETMPEPKIKSNKVFRSN
jgi:hypothetical protein